MDSLICKGLERPATLQSFCGIQACSEHDIGRMLNHESSTLSVTEVGLHTRKEIEYLINSTGRS